MFGDSYTASTCTGVATSADCYATILTNAAGFPANKYAVSGDQAADQVNNQMYPHLAPSYKGNAPVTVMIGENDAVHCGNTTGCLANYFHTVLSGLAYATIPVEQQIQPQTAITGGACTTTGTWTNVSYGNVQALQSIVPGSSITCSPYNIGPQGFYVNWLAGDSFTSTAALSIDSGAVIDTLNSFGFNGQAITTNNGTHQTAFANRYALAGSGAHTFTITVGTAGAGNPFTFLWAGSPTPSTPSALANFTQNPPRAYLAGVVKNQSGGAGPSDTVTAAYDAQAQNVASTLYGDGALAYYVPARAYVNNTTDFSGGTLANGLVCAASTGLPFHPGDCGSLHIADAFRSVMYLPNTPLTFTQTSTSITLTASMGTVFISSGTLTLPTSGIPVGQTFSIFNFSSSVVVAISGATQNVPTSLPPRAGIVIVCQATGSYYVLSSMGVNFLQGVATVSSSTTLTDSMGVLFINAGTVTLPTSGITTGRIITIYNYSTGANVSISGATHNVPTSIPPLTSLTLLLQNSGANWYMLSQTGNLSSGTNCASSASPAVCSTAPAGAFVVAAGATAVTVNTTAVTANSQIDVKFDASLGARLSVTCNTTFVNAWPSARVAGTSFTITVALAPTTNPACFGYTIVN